MEQWTVKGKLGFLTIAWRGPELEKSGRAACANTLNQIMDLCVLNAKSLVRVDKGNLRDSLAVYRRSTVGSVYGIWGTRGIRYWIYQELGPLSSAHNWAFTPYLRPSADRYYRIWGPEVLKKIHV